MALDKIIDDFLKDLKLRNMADQTITNYKSNIRIFFDFINNKNISFDTIDGRNLKEFLMYLKENRGNSLKRINNYFATISTFFDYLISEDLMSTNPVPPIRKRYLRGYKKEARHGFRRAISV